MDENEEESDTIKIGEVYFREPTEPMTLAEYTEYSKRERQRMMQELINQTTLFLACRDPFIFEELMRTSNE